MKILKSFLISLIVLLILVGGLEVFLIIREQKNWMSVEENLLKTPYPTPEIPSDWKTYRNGEYGFEISYPNGWNVEDDTQNDCFPENPCIFSFFIHSSIPTDWIGIMIFDNLDMLSAKEWLYKFRKMKELEKLDEFFLTQIEIGGKKGVRLTYLPPHLGTVTWQDAIYISKREIIYEISLPGLPSEGVRETIDQILSRFRFLE